MQSDAFAHVCLLDNATIKAETAQYIQIGNVLGSGPAMSHVGLLCRHGVLALNSSTLGIPSLYAGLYAVPVSLLTIGTGSAAGAGAAACTGS